MISIYTKKDSYFSFAVAVFGYLIAQLVLGSLLSWAQTGSFWYCVIYACVSLCVFLLAFLYSKVVGKNFWQATTANVKPNIIHALWGCLATFGLIHFMLPINEWLLDFIEWCGLSRPSADFDMPLVAMIVIVGLLAPVAEEFLFRGTIGQGNKSWMGVVVNGALFALFHMNPAQTLHQFVLGGFLMLLTWRSGSVWTSVIVHAFNNLAVLFLSYVVEPTGFYQNKDILLLVVGGVIFVGSVVGYLLTTKSSKTLKCADKTTKIDSEKALSQGKNQQKQAFVYQGAKPLFFVAVAICVVMWIAVLFSE